MPLLLTAAFALGICLGWLLRGVFPSQAAETPSGAPEPSDTSDGSEPAPPVQASGGEDEDWALTLVNPWNPLPEDHSIQTAAVQNSFRVDVRCRPALEEMLSACQAEGLSPLICSAYRTWEYQEQLYQNQVERYLALGFSQAGAEEKAGQAVAVPGTSEHQLGLAVDIVDLSYQQLDRAQEDTAVQQWLMAHSWEYGFILRYPSEKSEVTGIIYEPWHYRYVGREAAKEIFERGVCLEEYLEAP